MNTVRFIAIGCLFIALFSACSKKDASPEEIEKYLLDTSHGLTQESEAHGVKVQAIWRPVSLIAFQDAKSVKGNPDSLYKNSFTKYGQNTYFIINISGQGQDVLNQTNGTEAYGKNVEKLSFHMDDNVFLVTPASDTIYAGDYSYPRMYGMSKMSSLLVAFAYSMPEQAEWLDLHIKDSGLGIGNRTFRYYRKDIIQIPALALEN